MSWHLLDPVSQEEVDRNENGFLHQNNRNPFIDNPTYVQAIWDENFSTTDFSSFNVDVYPNPVKGNVFTVSVINKSDLLIEVYSILGKKILNTLSSQTNTTIPVQDWSKGVYLVKISDSKQSKTIKLVVQ